MGAPDIVLKKKPFTFAYWKESGVIVLEKFYIGKGKNRIQMDTDQMKLMVKLLRESIEELRKKKII